MGLFTPEWMKPGIPAGKRDKIIEKVRKLSEKDLIKAATEAPLWYIRRTAVEELTDQQILAEIGRNAREWYIREAALKNLTDQHTLAGIAINGEDRSVREIAVKKLTDRSALAALAVKAEDITELNTVTELLGYDVEMPVVERYLDWLEHGTMFEIRFALDALRRICHTVSSANLKSSIRAKNGKYFVNEHTDYEPVPNHSDDGYTVHYDYQTKISSHFDMV